MTDDDVAFERRMTVDAAAQWLTDRLVEHLPARDRSAFYASAFEVIAKVRAIIEEAEQSEMISTCMD